MTIQTSQCIINVAKGMGAEYINNNSILNQRGKGVGAQLLKILMEICFPLRLTASPVSVHPLPSSWSMPFSSCSATCIGREHGAGLI